MPNPIALEAVQRVKARSEVAPATLSTAFGDAESAVRAAQHAVIDIEEDLGAIPAGEARQEGVEDIEQSVQHLRERLNALARELRATTASARAIEEKAAVLEERFAG